MKEIFIKEIKTNDYLTKSKLPSADYVINPYIGCPHGCKYCYASFMKKFTKHNEKWGDFVDVKLCDKKIDISKLKNKTIFLSSVTDCYNTLEKKYKITRNILKELKHVDGTINISTKSNLILRDLDLLKECKKVIVCVSINTLNEDFRRDMDNASTIKERLETLKDLHNNGFYTVLFISPIFPYITDFRKIIDVSKDYVDEYWFENLNLRGDYKKDILKYIKDKYPIYYNNYIDIYNKKNLKYWVDLSKNIEHYCKTNNIKYVNYFYHEKLKKK